jgi:rhamnulokinase
MASSIHLAIDLGAASGRVMAAAWDGARVSVEEVRRFPNDPVWIGESLRWDLPFLLREIELGLARAAALYGGRIASVGADTWALDYVLLSKSGEWLGLPFCYRDARTRGGVQALQQTVPRGEVFAASGLQFMEINTLCQWMAHHTASPEVFAAAARFQMIADCVHHSLCGTEAVEFTNATTTQFFDPTAMRWADGLLRRCGLPTHLLPQVVMPGANLGPLRPTVRRRTGLAEIPVVAPATHDTGSAVVGAPAAPGGGWAFVSAGTWFLVGVERSAPLLGPDALAFNVTNEGGFGGTWRVLKNVSGLWLFDQLRRSLGGPDGPMAAAHLAAEALEAPAWRHVVDPDDPSLMNPENMGSALRTLCLARGGPGPATRGELARCALESAALKTALVVDQLEALGGERIRVVHVVGGGSKNAALCQWIADAAGRPVVAGPAEATALGNAVVQIGALNRIGSLAEMREVVRASSLPAVFEPRPDPSGPAAAARARVLGAAAGGGFGK